ILDGSLNTPLDFLANADASETISMNRQDLTLGGLNLTGLVLTDEADATAALTAVETALADASAKLAELGAQSKQIEKHTIFVTKLMDSLEVGVGNLGDADMARESERLQALQVLQELVAQALARAQPEPPDLLQAIQGL